jgi:hypothetical protein
LKQALEEEMVLRVIVFNGRDGGTIFGVGD